MLHFVGTMKKIHIRCPNTNHHHPLTSRKWSNFNNNYGYVIQGLVFILTNERNQTTGTLSGLPIRVDQTLPWICDLGAHIYLNLITNYQRGSGTTLGLAASVGTVYRLYKLSCAFLLLYHGTDFFYTPTPRSVILNRRMILLV